MRAATTFAGLILFAATANRAHADRVMHCHVAGNNHPYVATYDPKTQTLRILSDDDGSQSGGADERLPARVTVDDPFTITGGDTDSHPVFRATFDRPKKIEWEIRQYGGKVILQIDRCS